MKTILIFCIGACFGFYLCMAIKSTRRRMAELNRSAIEAAIKAHKKEVSND